MHRVTYNRFVEKALEKKRSQKGGYPNMLKRKKQEKENIKRRCRGIKTTASKRLSCQNSPKTRT
jgi:hypothetical protein